MIIAPFLDRCITFRYSVIAVTVRIYSARAGYRREESAVWHGYESENVGITAVSAKVVCRASGEFPVDDQIALASSFGADP